MIRSAIKNWAFAFKLTVPVFIFFGLYLANHSKELTPTGFIQYDNVSYIAFAKQYLDADALHWQYANPFNDQELSPIYFQPQTLFFAFLLKMGVPPGIILIPFTIICALVCFRLMIGIYDLLIEKNEYRVFSIWMFAWGGGVLVISGILFHFTMPTDHALAGDLFALDPEHGWWGLNAGRALLFSCEAYYHALFFGCVFFLLKRKWLAGLILMFILLLSHPFTSIELIGIICCWVFIEFIINRRFLPWWFISGVTGCLALYTWYYLFYLNQFPDHRSVADQYSLNWRLGIYRIIPAYLLVGILAIVAIFKKTALSYFNNYATRLFACWFIVAFLLANHEWFLKARQPIHFTRGYIWTSLFLLGLPALQQLNAALKNKWGKIGLAGLAVVFFLDNFSWMLINSTSKATQTSTAYITQEHKKIFDYLKKETTNHTLLISNDELISYMSTLYTEAYPWVSHPYTTPFVQTKKSALNRWMQSGETDPAWAGRKVVFVLRKDGTINMQRLFKTFQVTHEYDTDNFVIFKCDSLLIKSP